MLLPISSIYKVHHWFDQNLRPSLYQVIQPIYTTRLRSRFSLQSLVLQSSSIPECAPWTGILSIHKTWETVSVQWVCEKNERMWRLYESSGLWWSQLLEINRKCWTRPAPFTWHPILVPGHSPKKCKTTALTTCIH